MYEKQVSRMLPSLLLLVFIIGTGASPLTNPIGAPLWPGSYAFPGDLGNMTTLNAQQCFHRQLHDIQMKPIHYPDCIKAAEKATFGDKAGAPMHFSRDPHSGMQLPELWAHGSCVVRIDMKQQEDQDTFSLFIVANAASLIAQKCSDFTPSSPGLGGLGLVGPKKVVTLFVYGRRPPPAPRPRPSLITVASRA